MAEPGSIKPDKNDPDSLRLFFALWPDDTTRDALYRTGKWLHKHWGGRLMRRDTLHITLAFLGATPINQLENLFVCADSVQADAFDLNLDQAGYWRHNRIGWLGAKETSLQHVDLVERLNAKLMANGFPVDTRPHVPHVTLLRNTAGGEPPASEPVGWLVRDFVLVKSVTEADGSHYDVIRRWPLA